MLGFVQQLPPPSEGRRKGWRIWVLQLSKARGRRNLSVAEGSNVCWCALSHNCVKKWVLLGETWESGLSAPCPWLGLTAMSLSLQELLGHHQPAKGITKGHRVLLVSAWPSFALYHWANHTYLLQGSSHTSKHFLLPEMLSVKYSGDKCKAKRNAWRNQEFPMASVTASQIRCSVRSCILGRGVTLNTGY